MATLPQLEKALVNADRAGDTDAARRLAAAIKQERARREADPSIEVFEQVPGHGPEEVPGTTTPQPEGQSPGILDRIGGVLETPLAVGSAMTTGLIGQIEGTVEGILREIASGEFGSYDAADRIEELAMKRAQQLSIQPETETGRQIMGTIGDIAEPLAAIPPTAEFSAAANAMSRAPMRQTAQQAGQAVAEPTRQIASEISRRVRERLPEVQTKLQPQTRGTGASVGAAGVDQATLRQARADELPVPIRLTQGQRTRDFNDQRFERETAKMPEGAPIRDRFDDQNLQLQQNMDAFIDATGSELTDLRGVGEIVDRALRNRAARDKVRIRSLYKEAEKAGEMEAPVILNDFVKHLADSAPEAEVANVLKAVQGKAKQLGALVEGPNGELIARPISLKDAELLRRSINNATNAEPTNIRQAAIMKGLIDEATEGQGGDKYRRARAARAKYARDYENIGLVKNLLGLKRGTDDRAIAFEDVLRKSILEPSASLDSVRQVRRLLQTGGDEGKQAWRELQGATLRHIQEQMTKGVTTNQRGDRIVSAAQLDRVISQLDKSGKLDFIFGKKGAEQLRTINEVAKDVLTSPPGAVNHSNTATVLAGLMDVALSGATGIPAPVASGFKMVTDRIKSSKLKAKIKKTLGE